MRSRLVLFFLPVVACTQAPNTSPLAVAQPSRPPTRIGATVDTPLEARTLTGTLHTTKGAQLMLGGVIIPDSVLAAASPGDDKRMARDRWLRKRVEVRAMVKRYICDPREQCLVGGSIPFAKRVLSIRELGPAE